jgi:hypothetical protein
MQTQRVVADFREMNQFREFPLPPAEGGAKRRVRAGKMKYAVAGTLH